MVYLIVIIIYLVIMIGLGISKASSIKTQADFSVAGRSLSPWVLVGTMLATWIGTGSVLGNAGKTYETGLAALILPLGGVLGIVILISISGKVRSFEKYTVPEVIGDRFGSTARVLAVIALVMAYMVIVSYQFNAGGAVLHTVLMDETGSSLISVEMGTVIAAVCIIAYTVLAGLVSVAYTDVANGIILTGSFIFAIPIFFYEAGGLQGMQASFETMGKPENMQFFGVFTPLNIINFTLPSFLLVMGDANLYQRFFASRDAKGATFATTILVFAVLLVEIMIISSAWISSSMIPDAEVGKYVLIYASYEFLPTFLGAIMMTTIVGIIISTADSFLLVPATTLIRDIYLRNINANASEKTIVLYSRILVLILGFIAYLVSVGFSKSTGFFEKSLYAYTIYGAAITPSIIAALFWKRATSAGSISSILAGTVTTLLWKEAPFVKNIIGPEWYGSIDAVLPAIGMSVLCLFLVSLATSNSKAKAVEEVRYS